jgi:GT2 family glycosyltransferase
MPMPETRLAVVIVTHNRLMSLLSTLDRLRSLPERPRIVVVDNGSSDGTPGAIAGRYFDVEVVSLRANLGAAARNVGARLVNEPFVAFCDDDSWWAPGALGRAADLLEAHPRLALVAARVLVGPEGHLDATCRAMAVSPLPTGPGLPGPSVLGFLACGAVVRRSAFLEVGGFHGRFGIGGEEELLAIDLAAAGWDLAYVDELVAYHHPSTLSDRTARRRVQVRNALWCAWLRRPARVALRRTASMLRAAFADPEARAGLVAALGGIGYVLRERRRIPPHIEHAIRLLEGVESTSAAANAAVESLARFESSRSI